jgi:esterase/lipase
MSFVKKYWYAVVAAVVLIVWIAGNIYIAAILKTSFFNTEWSKDSLITGYTTKKVDIGDGQSIEVRSFLSRSSPEVVLYLSGTVGPIDMIVDALSRTQNLVYPLYPGYANTAGKPTQENVYASADKTLEMLLASGYSEDSITVVGHSLGGQNALQLAQKHPNLKKYVLINTLISPKESCGPLYPTLCTFADGSFLNSNKVIPTEKVKNLIYVQAKYDDVINLKSAQKLYDKIPAVQKKYFLIPGNHSSFPINKIMEIE